MTDEDEIRSAVEQFRQRHDVPGVSLCTFSSAGPGLAVASGQTSVRRSARPVNPETRFRIYSITKMMTGTVAVAMAADGLVDLDVSVEQYVPELAAWASRSDRPVTLRLLLSHQAGLMPDALTSRAMSREPDGLRQAVLHDLPRLPRLAEPGEVYSYSSIAISLAGLVMERASGLPFRVLVRDRLLRPLQMTATTHDPDEMVRGPHAQHHLADADGRLRVAHDARLGIRYETSSLCYSTPTDIARFGAMHLGTAGSVPSAALAEIRNRHAELGLDIDMSYGLTCYRTHLRDGRMLFGHEGFFAGMWAKLIIDPERDFGVVWMDNRGDELREHRYRLLTRLFGVPGRAAGQRGDSQGATPDTAAVSGHYERAGDDRLDVQAAAATLNVVSGDRCVPLRQSQAGLWVSHGRSGPGAAPWGPHAGSQRVCLTTTRAPDGTVRFVHLNGLPYRRAAA